MFGFLQNIINAILPPRCLRCGKILHEENGLCGDCFASIRFIGSPHCLHCGTPLPVGENAQGCPICLNGELDCFRLMRSRVYYDENSKPLITNFKFRDKTENALFLSRWLYTAGHDIWEQGADILVPVPLHLSRLRQRKYNQSALLCSKLSRLIGIPVNYTGLKRHKKTRPQVECTGSDRKRNVKKAFSISPSDSFKGQRVVLIDDVMTTGSTLKECALTLLADGAKSVDALTVARVVKD